MKRCYKVSIFVLSILLIVCNSCTQGTPYNVSPNSVFPDGGNASITVIINIPTGFHKIHISIFIDNGNIPTLMLISEPAGAYNNENIDFDYSASNGLKAAYSDGTLVLNQFPESALPPDYGELTDGNWVIKIEDELAFKATVSPVTGWDTNNNEKDTSGIVISYP